MAKVKPYGQIRTRVRDYFQQHPDKLNDKVSQVAAELGTTTQTINVVKKQLQRNGHAAPVTLAPTMHDMLAALNATKVALDKCGSIAMLVECAKTVELLRA